MSITTPNLRNRLHRMPPESALGLLAGSLGRRLDHRPLRRRVYPSDLNVTASGVDGVEHNQWRDQQEVEPLREGPTSADRVMREELIGQVLSRHDFIRLIGFHPVPRQLIFRFLIPIDRERCHTCSPALIRLNRSSTLGKSSSSCRRISSRRRKWACTCSDGTPGSSLGLPRLKRSMASRSAAVSRRMEATGRPWVSTTSTGPPASARMRACSSVKTMRRITSLPLAPLYCPLARRSIHATA